MAIIGQSSFAGEVYKLLRKDGHTVVGVFTVPDQGSREDPVGEHLLPSASGPCSVTVINIASDFVTADCSTVVTLPVPNSTSTE